MQTNQSRIMFRFLAHPMPALLILLAWQLKEKFQKMWMAKNSTNKCDPLGQVLLRQAQGGRIGRKWGMLLPTLSKTEKNEVKCAVEKNHNLHKEPSTITIPVFCPENHKSIYETFSPEWKASLSSMIAGAIQLQVLRNAVYR